MRPFLEHSNKYSDSNAGKLIKKETGRDAGATRRQAYLPKSKNDTRERNEDPEGMCSKSVPVLGKKKNKWRALLNEHLINRAGFRLPAADSPTKVFVYPPDTADSFFQIGQP